MFANHIPARFSRSSISASLPLHTSGTQRDIARQKTIASVPPSKPLNIGRNVPLSISTPKFNFNRWELLIYLLF